VVVAAAGNAGTCRPFWPAALPEVTAVGAVDGYCRERALFSNYGKWVDAYAPGVDVISTFLFHDGPVEVTDILSGAAIPNWIQDPDHYEGWAMWSGTSFAAPYVAGAIAHLMCSENKSAKVAKEFVLQGAGPIEGIVLPEPPQQ
jgi:subtilisin family serine protease